jgi:hypothetical protein
MAGIRAQLQEAIYYFNDIGAKSRLLSAKLGRNPQAEAEGDTTVLQALSELYSDFKAFKAATEGDSGSKRGMLAKLGKQDTILQRLDTDMNKLYIHYKGHLVTSNERMIEVEMKVSTLQNAPNTQPQEGVFDFGQNQSTSLTSVERELQRLREEISNIKQTQATPTDQQKAPSRTTDNLFPGSSQEEILA